MLYVRNSVGKNAISNIVEALLAETMAKTHKSQYEKNYS